MARPIKRKSIVFRIYWIPGFCGPFFDIDCLRALHTYPYAEAAGSIDLADLLYILFGTGTLTEDEVVPGSYPALVLAMKRALACLFEVLKDKELTMEFLSDLVSASYKTREFVSVSLQGSAYADVCKLLLRLPARVLVYLAAERADYKFWSLWHELKDVVYHDEVMSAYASTELQQERQKKIALPIAKIRTTDYLRVDDNWAFHDTPKELSTKPAYFLTDDERLFWWDGTDEVIISPTCDEWLCGLAERHKKLMEQAQDTTLVPTSPQGLIRFFRDINKRYKRVCGPSATCSIVPPARYGTCLQRGPGAARRARRRACAGGCCHSTPRQILDADLKSSDLQPGPRPYEALPGNDGEQGVEKALLRVLTGRVRMAAG